jgi:aldehyde:ferredoxin oxidoreductase
MKGYAGRILRVDLTAGTATSEPLSPELARDYVGGRGLAARILYDEVAPGTDPLGPDNLFILATGPLAGSGIAGSTRYITACKSPLTGGWGEANAAGRFGPMMKAAGFDAIVVKGQSPTPVYLYANAGKAELRDARGLWGKFIADAREDILAATDARAEVALIGPAGEGQCKFACVISENNRAAGRSGTGAVMGAKRLKAVAVFGEARPELHDPERLAGLRREIVKLCNEHPACQGFRENGTAGGVGPHNALGMYPAYNFREGVSDNIDLVTGPTMTKTILARRDTCAGCPVACRRVVKIEEGPFAVDSRYGGPEFETIGSLGTCVGVYNLEAISKANELCNKYGVDTINTGLAIAWAMECFELGLLSREDTGGLDLTWGNVDAVFQLIADISLRRGLGALLAEGLKVAAARVGRGSEAFALHVKNQAFPVHMPRGKIGQGLSFATSNRGACHTQGMHDTQLEAGKTMPDIGFTDKFKGLSRMSKDLKGEAIALAQDLRAIQDSLIICRFTSWDYGPTPPAMLAEAMTAITGEEFSSARFMEIGARVFNLCRLFNVREGMSRKDDTLPARMAEPLPRGATSGSVITPADLDRMLDEYYDFRGWTRQGIPTPEKLAALGLKA